ncbi:MAG TPA: DUF58 domain-containing protein [Myxococcota bacterium]|nr:DUF58 domain-containing protein [Myxococcota bacterium]
MTGVAQKPRSGLFDDAFLKRLEYLEIVARKTFAALNRGERRSKRLGAGLEFVDHRRYSPGDDFRNIDWNVYARLGKLLLRLYEEEEDLFVYVLVDASLSMTLGDQKKLEHAKKIGASLAYIALANLDRASLVTFAERLTSRMMPVRGKGQIFRIFDFFDRVDPGGRTSFEESMKAFVHDTKRRGLVVVLSDFYAQDGWEAGLNLLRYHRFEPVVIQLTDQRELEPNLRGDVLLVDAETGEQKEITLTPKLLQKYRAAHAAFCAELEGYCKSNHLPYFQAPVQRPFDEVVLTLLRSGGFLA